MARSLDDEFTYFIKIVDDTNEQYYLKSTIDEQNHTILIHLTNFKHSWVGVRKCCFFDLLIVNVLMEYFSQSRTSSNFSKKIPIGNK
jgi:hypothetical protein